MLHVTCYMIVVPESESENILRKERTGLALIVLVFVVPGLLFLGFLAWGIGETTLISSPGTVVEIEPGTGFLEISKTLERLRVIRRASLFRFYVVARGWADKLQDGEYLFRGEIRIPDAARRLISGPGDITVTIPEGWTVREMDDRLSGLRLIGPRELLVLAQSPQSFSSFIFLRHPDITTLEGFLFPDTYQLNRRMGAKAIIEKMLKNFEAKALPIIQEKLENPSPLENRSLFGVLTLASLIEKEAPNPDDRRIISGILWKRLEFDVPLQVDATIVYAWKQINPSWTPKGHALGANDLKINSPYNTYRIKGLPPGPISNPGLEAINSVLEPEDSPYWYYLSSKEGATIFSKTLQEHNIAKAKYLR